MFLLALALSNRRKLKVARLMWYPILQFDGGVVYSCRVSHHDMAWHSDVTPFIR